MSPKLQNWPPKDKSFGKLSKAKRLILQLLWPMEWMQGAEIFKAVQQTYYDRRIRELRESGWKIKTVGAKYRLVSREKLAGDVRKYPTTKQKHEVYERDKGICQICDASDEHLQYDHKVPRERLGRTEADNLQLLCRSCNVEKRGICKRCTLSACDGCPYAYPEQFGSRFAVFLDQSIGEKLRLNARQRGVPETSIIAEIISQHYTEK